MNPFIEKYHQTKGTHCWYCEREFGRDKTLTSSRSILLRITREHIVPKSVIIYSYHRNYISACSDCNSLKAKRDARQFALHIDFLIKNTGLGKHNMYKYFRLMKDRAWKLYNKTSSLHKNYKTMRLN